MFIETRLLDNVSYGSSYGHRYSTRIVSLESGHENRNANWTLPLGVYSVIFPLLRPEDHIQVISAHHICKGRAFGFRLRDWANFKATAEEFGTGTGASEEYQLVKTYAFGSGTANKEIYKPIASTVEVFADGVPVAHSLDDTTGLVTVTAANGAVLTWTGEYDIPVRFSSDEIHFTLEGSMGEGRFALQSNVDLEEFRPR